MPHPSPSGLLPLFNRRRRCIVKENPDEGAGFMETYFKNMTGDEGTKQRLVKDLITLVHDAEDLVKATGGDIADRSKKELMEALERVKASCKRLEEQAATSLRAADRAIRQHPYESMGIALGLGLVLGVLLNRD